MVCNALSIVFIAGDQPNCYEQSCHCVLTLGMQLHLLIIFAKDVACPISLFHKILLNQIGKTKKDKKQDRWEDGEKKKAETWEINRLSTISNGRYSMILNTNKKTHWRKTFSILTFKGRHMVTVKILILFAVPTPSETFQLQLSAFL